MKQPKILIMAGGTGGHVFRGLAIAKNLQESKCKVIWLGTKRGIESRLVEEAGIDIEYINVGGLRGKSFRAFMRSLGKLMLAFFQSFVIILRQRPDVVLGMGGYVTGPGAIMAYIMRCPVIIHEQNAVAGGTNKL